MDATNELTYFYRRLVKQAQVPTVPQVLFFSDKERKTRHYPINLCLLWINHILIFLPRTMQLWQATRNRLVCTEGGTGSPHVSQWGILTRGNKVRQCLVGRGLGNLYVLCLSRCIVAYYFQSQDCFIRFRVSEQQSNYKW